MSSLFRDIMRHSLVIGHRPFWTSYLSHLQGSSNLTLKMETKICHETSVTSYQRTLRNIPEERMPQLHRGGVLTPRNGEDVNRDRDVD